VLRRHGYQAFDAPSPERALEIAASRTPLHLLIINMMTPGAQGAELVQSILSLRSGLPILYTSGHLEQPSPATSTSLHLLPKPFSAQALISKIRDILG
jgi:DNA-binding response OmpR family regulator